MNICYNFTLLGHFAWHGWIPEWPKGTDCKSAANCFGGSNPPPSIKPMWLNWQSSWFVISRLSVRVRSSAFSNLIIIAGWSSLEARRAHNPKVIGSNPVPATQCPDSSVGRAEDWKSSCHWFDSGSGHFFILYKSLIDPYRYRNAS